MSDIEQTLAQATGLSRNGDARGTWLEKVARAAARLPDDEFYGLPADSQDWVNDAVEKIRAKKEVIDPANFAGLKIIKGLNDYQVTYSARRLLEKTDLAYCRRLLRMLADKERELGYEKACRIARRSPGNPADPSKVTRMGKQELRVVGTIVERMMRTRHRASGSCPTLIMERARTAKQNIA